MKYAALGKIASKRYCVPGLSGGIAHENSADNCVKELSNMWFKNGMLTTRPALRIEDDGFVFETGPSENIVSPVENSGVRITSGGREYEVVSALVSDFQSYYKLCIFLADSSGNVLNAGEIVYNRIDDDNFYIPERYFFITADPTVGDGLYAFVTSYTKSRMADYAIYEFSSAENSWQMLQEDDFYIPTLYVNGRGTSYYTAELNGTAYKYSPMLPESQNLLTGRFYAYYTSDNYSSGFKLPVSEIDNSMVTCRIYTKADSYFEWRIGPDETEDTQLFTGYDITLKCDRAAGVLQFYNGEDLFPIIYLSLFPDNNIRISASKTVPNGLERVIGGAFSAAFDSRLYIGGNKVSPNEIYSSKRTNPMYFPVDQGFKVGENTGAVTALSQRDGELFVFKSDEVYKLTVTQGKKRTVNGFGADENLQPFYSDTARSVPLHTSIGCTDRKSLRLCDNILIWRACDRKVYAILPQDRLVCISLPIDKKLSDFDDCCCTAFYDGYYMLFYHNRIYLLDVRRSSLSQSSAIKPIWYCWTLPEAVYIRAVLTFGGALQLISMDKRLRFMYLANFGGTKDRVYDIDKVQVYADISAYFITAAYDFSRPELRKNFDSLFLTAAAVKEINVSCDGKESIVSFDMSDEEYQNGECRTVSINPHTYGKCALAVRLASDHPFSVKSLTFNYRELSEVR